MSAVDYFATDTDGCREVNYRRELGLDFVRLYFRPLLSTYG